MPEPMRVTGADLDQPLRHAQALHALTDLVDAAGSLEGVRPEALAALLAVLVEPMEAQLMALAERAGAAAQARAA